MRDFYARYGVQDGDELVLHVLGEDRFELIPERVFRWEVNRLEADLDGSGTEVGAEIALNGLASVTHSAPGDVAASEFNRLAAAEVRRRNVRAGGYAATRESVPPSVRLVLENVYHGCCQVTGFSFLKKDGRPYFEVHHIDPAMGHHVKNVLVVSPNVHAEFTYAAVEHDFDKLGWLRGVSFNGRHCRVFQAVDRLARGHTKQVHTA